MIFELINDYDILKRFLGNFLNYYKPKFPLNHFSYEDISMDICYEVNEEAYFMVDSIKIFYEILHKIRTIDIENNEQINKSLIGQLTSISNEDKKIHYSSDLLELLDLHEIFKNQVQNIEKVQNIKIPFTEYAKSSRKFILDRKTVSILNEQCYNIEDLNKDIPHLEELINRGYFLKDNQSSKIIFPFFILFIYSNHSEFKKSLPNILNLIKNIGIVQLNNFCKDINKDSYNYFKKLLNQKVPQSDILMNIKKPFDKIEYFSYNSIPKKKLDFNDFKSLIILINQTLSNFNKNEENKKKITQFLHFNTNLYKNIESTLNSLKEYSKRIENNKILLKNEYWNDISEIKIILKILGNSYFELSNLEERIGSERFLENLFLPELKIVHNKVKNISEKANRIFNFKYFQNFIDKWSISELKRIILNLSDSKKKSSLLDKQFNRNYDNIIIFIIDGFGYTQYRWIREFYNEKLISGNFFDRLFKFTDNSKELILGSSLVPDTIIGLSKIFFGLKLSELTIPAKSYIQSNGNGFEYKRINFYEMGNILKNKISILRTLEQRGYYCSFLTTQSNKFSKNVYHRIEIFDKKRGFFKNLSNILSNFKNHKKNCLIVYYNYIDKEGHSIGPFSSFELNEMEKLNLFLFNFLLEIRANKLKKDTLLLIYSDHGFFECNPNKFIIREELEKRFNDLGFFICHNNRSLFISPKDSRRNNKKELEMIKSVFFDFGFSEKDYILKKNDDNKILGEEYSLTRKRSGKYFFSFKNDGLIIDEKYLKNSSYFTGNHCGLSVEEFFVPLLIFPLDQNFFKELFIL